MSCRAARKATDISRNVQHLWVSDEQLATAFDRFLKVSLTHRRYGSSCPGPLEAQKRLAKRKMGLVGAVNTPPPPGSDFGALFGFGSSQPPDFEKGWKWQAPIPVVLRPGTKSHTPGSRGTEPEQRLQHEDVEHARRIANFLDVPQNYGCTRREQFEELLHKGENKTRIEEEVLRPLLEFLRTSQDADRAELTGRLLDWMGGRALSENARMRMSNHICDSILRRNLGEGRESAVLMQLLQRADAASFFDNILPNLGDEAPAMIRRTTEALLASPQHYRAPLDRWTAYLESYIVTKVPLSARQDMWNPLYGPLTERTTLFSLFEDLEGPNADGSARFIFRYWLTQLTRTMLYGTEQAHSPNINNKQTSPTSNVLPSEVESVDWDALLGQYQDRRNEDTIPALAYDPLVDLMSILALNNLDYSTVLENAFQFRKTTATPDQLVRLAGQVRRARLNIPASVANTMLQYFIERRELNCALQFFNLVPTVVSSEAPGFVLQLIEHAHFRGPSIWEPIDQWAEEEGVSRHQALTTDQYLSQELTDKVHEAAYAWAISPHLRPRVAFRRVWECYNFLRDARAPLSKLLTRALVRAGILNFMQIGTPVPQSRVRYILDLIEIVEGRQVRAEVDELIFNIWRERKRYGRHKTSKVKKDEKYWGRQILADGSSHRVTWHTRVRRKAVEIRQHEQGWLEHMYCDGETYTPFGNDDQHSPTTSQISDGASFSQQEIAISSVSEVEAFIKLDLAHEAPAAVESSLEPFANHTDQTTDDADTLHYASQASSSQPAALPAVALVQPVHARAVNPTPSAESEEAEGEKVETSHYTPAPSSLDPIALPTNVSDRPLPTEVIAQPAAVESDKEAFQHVVLDGEVRGRSEYRAFRPLQPPTHHPAAINMPNALEADPPSPDTSEQLQPAPAHLQSGTESISRNVLGQSQIPHVEFIRSVFPVILKHHVHAEPRISRQLIRRPDPQPTSLDDPETLAAAPPPSDSLDHPQLNPEPAQSKREHGLEAPTEAIPSLDSPEHLQPPVQLVQSETEDILTRAVAQSSVSAIPEVKPHEPMDLEHHNHATLRIIKQGSGFRSAVSAPEGLNVLDSTPELYAATSLESTAHRSDMGFRRLSLFRGSTRKPLGSVFEIKCRSAALYDKGSLAPIVSETSPPDALSRTTTNLPEWWTDENADALVPLSAAQRTLGKKLSQYHRLERRRLKYLVKTGVLERGATKVDLRLWQMQHRPQDLEGRARVPV